MHSRGGVHGRGMHGWGFTWQGVYMVGGEACMAGECAWKGACMAGQTATAVDGTHPTGMHSCNGLLIMFGSGYRGPRLNLCKVSLALYTFYRHRSRPQHRGA